MRFEKRFVHTPTAVLPQCHAATIAERGDGALVCAWYAGAYEKALDVAVYGATLEPGASEWQQKGVWADTPNLSEGNPILFDTGKGALWLFFTTLLENSWTSCQIKRRVSRDLAATWGSVELLRAETGWVTGCKPIRLPNGIILLPMYVETGGAFVWRSEDEGATWQMSNVINTPHGIIQPSLAPLSDGRLLMLLRTYERSGGTVWQSFSNDVGRTWTAPTRTELYNPNARLDVCRLESGRLALAFNDSPDSRTPLTLALSEDDGVTWPIRAHVETEPGEFSYPALIQTGDGLLHLAYTYRRTHIAHVACNEEWLLCNGNS